MCGICGIALTGGGRPDPEILLQMNAALTHRGPDAQGSFLKEGIGLAMSRLRVIDLATGDQPMCNETGSLWVVFNGEIFNFPELHQRLLQKGHQFKTRSDTECLLHLYEEVGDDLVQELNGQFAFALWDIPRRKLLLARDRLGEKPLYYCQQGDSLYFSSELTSLLAGLPKTPPVNLDAIDLYLSLQYIPDPLTAYQGIFKLPPAHTLTFQAGRLEVKRYWQLQYLPKWDAPPQELQQTLRQKLEQAVRMRMLSDVPLGAHLSGGIDSSIMVALMAQHSPRPLETFTVGFEEDSFSELPYARAVSQRYGTHAHEFILTFSHIPENLQKLARHFGEPFADSSALPLYLLAQQTRQHVTVVLNGDGGDDLFAGYLRHRLDPWADAYLRLPGFLTRRALPALTRLLPDRSGGPVGTSLLGGLKRLVQLTEIDSRLSILRWGSYFSPSQRRSLWRSDHWQADWEHSAEAWLLERYQALEGAGKLDLTLQADLQTYLPGDLLVKADRMSMAVSLEARSPFLDHELAEWVARLPEDLKLRRGVGKYLLKRAFADSLPESVLRHRKQGFGIPISTWLRGPLAAWSREALLSSAHLSEWFELHQVQTWLDEHQAARSDHGKRLWALLMLACWQESR